jgi:hypothetical protein
VARPETFDLKWRHRFVPGGVLGRPNTAEYSGFLRPCLATPDTRHSDANVPERDH